MGSSETCLVRFGSIRGWHPSLQPADVLIPNGSRNVVNQTFWCAVKAEVIVAALYDVHHLFKLLQLLLAV